jgi:hypothetical protein
VVKKRFFFEKRSKKLLLVRVTGGFASMAQSSKSFLRAFFQKSATCFTLAFCPAASS